MNAKKSNPLGATFAQSMAICGRLAHKAEAVMIASALCASRTAGTISIDERSQRVKRVVALTYGDGRMHNPVGAAFDTERSTSGMRPDYEWCYPF